MSSCSRRIDASLQRFLDESGVSGLPLGRGIPRSAAETAAAVLDPLAVTLRHRAVPASAGNA
jgi:hypothetical protein